MHKEDYATLSEAINALTKEGFKDGFRAEENRIVGSYTSNSYLPEELKIVQTYRFEGMTNPQDNTIVFAIEANDGNKGTLVMSYSAGHNQNVELIKKIPYAEK